MSGPGTHPLAQKLAAKMSLHFGKHLGKIILKHNEITIEQKKNNTFSLIFLTSTPNYSNSRMIFFLLNTCFGMKRSSYSTGNLQ